MQQAHQDHVPPDDVQPLLTRAGPLLAIAVSQAFELSTDFLLGIAEGNLPRVSGRAWHGWGEVGAGSSGAVRRGLLPFGRDSPHLASPPPSPSLQCSLRVPVLADGICCWRITRAAVGLNSAARKRRRERGAGGGAEQGPRGRGGEGGSARPEPGKKDLHSYSQSARPVGLLKRKPPRPPCLGSAGTSPEPPGAELGAPA